MFILGVLLLLISHSMLLQEIEEMYLGLANVSIMPFFRWRMNRLQFLNEFSLLCFNSSDCILQDVSNSMRLFSDLFGIDKHGE